MDLDYTVKSELCFHKTRLRLSPSNIVFLPQGDMQFSAKSLLGVKIGFPGCQTLIDSPTVFAEGKEPKFIWTCTIQAALNSVHWLFYFIFF